MKRIYKIVLIAFLLVLLAFCTIGLWCINKPIYDEIEEVKEQITTNDGITSLFLEENIVGILEIPTINFKSIIRERNR